MSIAPPKTPSENNLEILVIEDDVSMAILTREALRVADMHHGLVCMQDGEEALAYLHRDNQLPDLICLDLHLPRISGLQVLTEIKTDPRLKRIPVIIVSGVENPHEIREAYELHASCFVRKPADLEQFLYFVKICFEFWGSVVTLSPLEVD